MSSENIFDAVIIGAGAAGMMCALTAGQRGRRVLLLEGSESDFRASFSLQFTNSYYYAIGWLEILA